MTTYDNSNRGALFVNDRKEPDSKQPDYKGRVNCGGADYELSGWKKSLRTAKSI